MLGIGLWWAYTKDCTFGCAKLFSKMTHLTLGHDINYFPDPWLSYFCLHVEETQDIYIWLFILNQSTFH